MSGVVWKDVWLLVLFFWAVGMTILWVADKLEAK